ncbi:hypothetical protein BDN72DRAFT_912165 [Pluteus cervinus]|uniref:Uncharacterized protein n=1 Tax=Pluteus cervinus TaxID=181527 RepID=A0ACD3APU5_9AGAR|nr:hypothetical protein BDN72DRAFT_912165 [Pluteus cervinus]
MTESASKIGGVFDKKSIFSKMVVESGRVMSNSLRILRLLQAIEGREDKISSSGKSSNNEGRTSQGPIRDREQGVAARAGEIEPGVIITGYDRIARLFLATNTTKKEVDVANDPELISKFMKVVGILGPPPKWIGMRPKWGQEESLPPIEFDPEKKFN